jgi:hypothetical protein
MSGGEKFYSLMKTGQLVSADAETRVNDETLDTIPRAELSDVTSSGSSTDAALLSVTVQ